MPWPSRMRVRALAGGGEEHLGRRRVAVLLEEVVLDLPHVVDAEPVGELDLVERVLEQLVLVVGGPRAGAAGARRRCRTSRGPSFGARPRRGSCRRARGTWRTARGGRRRPGSAARGGGCRASRSRAARPGHGRGSSSGGSSGSASKHAWKATRHGQRPGQEGGVGQRRVLARMRCGAPSSTRGPAVDEGCVARGQLVERARGGGRAPRGSLSPPTSRSSVVARVTCSATPSRSASAATSLLPAGGLT